MNNRPNAPPGPANIKIKTRKRNQTTKFEPTAFRDAFLDLVKDAATLEEYQQLLLSSVDELDYKKYADTLFELIIVGCLVQPGGILSDDLALQNPISFFNVEADDWQTLRDRVEVVNKLIRRYKYLQVKLDDVLIHLLTYINKFGDNSAKLADACGIFFALQLASLPILAELFKDHLVKDGLFLFYQIGSSLKFITQVFHSYLKECPLDHLQTALTKSGVGNRLFDFFPQPKRTNACLAAHFEAEGLQSLVEHHLGMLNGKTKDVTRNQLIAMLMEGQSVGQVVEYAKSQMTSNSWTEQEVLPLMWEAFIESIDWAGKAEQILGQINKALTNWSAIFVPFCTSPKTELSLLLQIQSMCYEDARFMKFFVKIIQLLYKEDVLSDNALIYWFEKGASSQGKTVFLKQMDAFIQWVKSQDDDSDEE